MEEPLDRAVIHLIPGVLRSLQVECLVRARFHKALKRCRILGEFEVVPCDFDRHPVLNIAVGAAQREKVSNLLL